MKEMLVEFLIALRQGVVHWSHRSRVKIIEDGINAFDTMPLAEWKRYWWPEVHGSLLAIDADQKFLRGEELRKAAVAEMNQFLADEAMGVDR